MSDHDTWNAELERLWEAVVVGELSREDGSVRRAAESSREFRSRIDGLGHVEQRLEGERVERARILAQADAEAPTPGEEEALAAFRAHAGLVQERRSALPRPRRVPRLVLVLAAAAAVVLVVMVVARTRTTPPIPDDGGRVLDEGAPIRLLEPLPGAKEITAFRWTPSTDARVLQYEITVFDTSTAGAPVEVLRTKTLATEFLPRSPLPRELSWNVQALDASGAPVGRAASARLSY